MARDRLPSIDPDRPVTEHLVILHPTLTRLARRIKTIGQAHAFNRQLRCAAVLLRSLDPHALQHRRQNINDMMILGANAALIPNMAGPVHDQRIPDPAFMGILLVKTQRGIAYLGPSSRVVVVQIGAANGIDLRHHLLHRGPQTIEKGQFIERAIKSPFLTGAIVRKQDEKGIIHDLNGVQKIHQPTNLIVGVIQKPGKRFLHAGVQPLLVPAEFVPGCHPRVAR